MGVKVTSMWILQADVARIIGVTRKTLVAMVQRGEWPRPRQIGSRKKYRRAWIEHWARTGQWPAGVEFERGVGGGRV